MGRSVGPRHLFLSPHLDDAVLSCGALIHLLSRSADVIVATVFSGRPRRYAATPMGRRFLVEWGAVSDPMRVRREEDLVALSMLGASARHLGHLDCIYRTDAAGSALYPTFRSIARRPMPEPELDRALGDQLRGLVAEVEPAVVYGPLGIGRHVDHLVVRRAIDRMLRHRHLQASVTLLWEDVPYVCSDWDAGWRSELCEGLVRHPPLLGDGELKRRAVDAYRSQASTVWFSDKAKEDCLGRVVVGEALWGSADLPAEVLTALSAPEDAQAH